MKAIRIDLGNDTHALGVVFPDGAVYCHEPIADGYSSEADLLADLTGAKITLLGVVVPLDDAMRQLEEQCKEYVRQYNTSLREFQCAYERQMEQYDEIRAMLESYKAGAISQ